MIVRIYSLDNGIQVFVWLCPGCLAIRKRAKWDVKATPQLPQHPLTCDDCGALGDVPGSAEGKAA